MNREFHQALPKIHNSRLGPNGTYFSDWGLIIRSPLPTDSSEARRKHVLVGSNAASLLHTASEESAGNGALATNWGLSKCRSDLVLFSSLAGVRGVKLVLENTMTNKSYLICTSSNYSFESLNDDHVLCASNYMVPLFWYMLFEEKDLNLASVPCGNGEPNFEYNIFSSSKIEALELAKSRLPMMVQLFGEKVNELFYIWHSYIEGISGATIVLETCEIAMMSDPASYKNEIIQHISAFSANPIYTQGFFKKKKILNLNWKGLLEQAEISNTAIMPEAYKLCGYSLVKNVPWE